MQEKERREKKNKRKQNKPMDHNIPSFS